MSTSLPNVRHYNNTTFITKTVDNQCPNSFRVNQHVKSKAPFSKTTTQSFVFIYGNVFRPQIDVSAEVVVAGVRDFH